MAGAPGVPHGCPGRPGEGWCPGEDRTEAKHRRATVSRPPPPQGTAAAPPTRPAEPRVVAAHRQRLVLARQVAEQPTPAAQAAESQGTVEGRRGAAGDAYNPEALARWLAHFGARRQGGA